MIVVFGLQPLSSHLQGYIDWAIVNPATNHLGWYRASLQDSVLSWMWPTVFIVFWSLRKHYVRAWLIMLVLCLVARGGPSPFFQGSLTAEERWLLALESWYMALLVDAVVAAMALAVARQPFLLLIAVPIAASRICL